jgi:hypothetical protein
MTSSVEARDSFDLTITADEARACLIALRMDAKSHQGSPLASHQLKVAAALHDALHQLGRYPARKVS